ncbi:hypothetical protein ACHAW5_003502 [Stephanodiscus triporus]|uniref:PPIase cyclophilin-type domain-containing protein n=1 Tax=Stephanodiscus triporus TaxID=2934178 RepID=A0ABD3NI02_9STRA
MRVLSATTLYIVVTLAFAQEEERVPGEAAVDALLAYEGGDQYDMPVENNIDEDIREMPMIVTFVNEFPNQPATFLKIPSVISKSIDLFWEGPEDVSEFKGTIAPRGGSFRVNTFSGHEFSYEIDGTRHYFPPMDANENGEQYAILSGDVDGFLVRCELRPRDSSVLDDTVNLDLLVNPYWAPRGASQFLALVRRGYYDGVCFNRVVPEFLVQFGIAKDFTLRNEWIGNTIPDDETYENYPQFEPGYVSFAGSGPDSRTTEIFIVMPGASQEQLDYFGENSWETPFAVVQGDLEILTNIYSGYGDMPPWGTGPDPSRIYDADGYEYLAEKFPSLDYIDRCYVVNEEANVFTAEL